MNAMLPNAPVKRRVAVASLGWITLGWLVVWLINPVCVCIADEPKTDETNLVEPVVAAPPSKEVEVELEDAVEVEVEVEEPLADSPLAAPVWRGRWPRWIGLYGSQIADLVPEDFRPISIDELNGVLVDDESSPDDESDLPITRCLVLAKVEKPSEGSDRAAPDVHQGSESMMRSLSTTLFLPDDPDHSSSLRYRLGPLNLSVVRSGNPSQEDSSKTSILCGPRGEAFVVGRPGAEVSMDWSLRSERTHSGRQWLIRLPDATVTDFYVSVDASETINVEQGTVERVDFKTIRSLAKIASDEGQRRTWYRVETVPKSLIRLTVGPRQSDTSEITVVRGCRLSARCVGDQLKWSARLTLDRQAKIPRIRWSDGELTSLQRDGVEIRMDQDDIGYRVSNEASRSTSTVLIYEGVSPIAGTGSRLPLPRPLFDADRFFMPPQAWQLQLDMDASRLVSDFQLPDGWEIRHSNIAPGTSSAAGAAAVTSETPSPVSIGTSVGTVTRWIGSGPAPKGQDPWSISIERQNALVFASHQVRFEVDETSIEARGKLIVELPAGSIQPITLEVQDGFQFDFVGVGEARRNVTAQMSQGPSRQLTIWPGAEEIETNPHHHGRLVLYVNGRARRGAIADTRNRVTVPAKSVAAKSIPAKKPRTAPRAKESGRSKPASTANSASGENQNNESKTRSTLGQLWLTRVKDCPGQLLATIIPPTNLSWTAKAAIDPARIEFADLDSEQRQFFAPLPGDAIVFGGAIESTPVVELENPDVDLSVSIRTTVGLASHLITDYSDPRYDSLVQTTEVKTEGTSGVISNMRIRFAGNADESSGFEWSIRMRSGEPEIPIAESDVTREWIEPIGVWELRIALPAKYSNRSTLIGRRQRSMAGDADVASSDGVWLGLPNFPDAASQVAEVWVEPSLQLRRQTDSLLGVPTLATATNGEATHTETNRSWSRFRYEADDQSWIEVTRRRFTPPAVLIVQQRLRCVASVSGTDTLRLSCLARTDSDLRLSFPAGLQLTQVRLDGIAVSPKIILGREVVIPPINDRRWVSLEVDWISPASNDRWYRWYEFPAIELNELVIDARREVVTASGTMKLQMFANPWQRESSTAVLLVPSGTLGGIGWLSALMLLGLGRMTGTHGIPIITSGIGLAVLAGILWPSTVVPMTAFVAFPLTLAALQGSTAYWLRRHREDEDSSLVAAGSSSQRLESWPRPLDADDPRSANEFISLSGHSQTSPGSSRSDDSAPTQLRDAERDENSGADFSSSAILPCILAVWLSLSSSWLVPSHVEAQETSRRGNKEAGDGSAISAGVGPTDSASPAIDVLVPLKKDGTILGDKIYIPESFYNELFFKDVGPPLENALIAEAEYRLRLRSTSSLESGLLTSPNGADEAPPGEGGPKDPSATEQAATIVDILQSKDCVRLQVDLALRKPDGVRRLRLPYHAEQVQDVRVLDAAPANNTVGSGLPPRFGSDEAGWLWIETPDDGDLAVRLILRCQLDWEAPWVFVNANVPPLAISDLTVQTERNVHSVMFQTPLSSRFIPCEQPSISDPFASDSQPIAIGTMSQLNLRFRFDESSSARLPWNNPDQWRTRYWVYAQKQQTVVECELEPRLTLPPRAVVSLQTTLPGIQLLCQDWLIERRAGSDEDLSDADPSESLRLISMADQNQPIRLGWTILTPQDVRATGEGSSWDVNLPQVRVGTSPIRPMNDNDSFLTENLPWTAWTFSTDVQPDWSQPLTIEPLAVDQFYSQWSGYLRSIDRATIGFVGKLTLESIEKPRTQWLTRHAIDINATEQRIEFLAEIKPPVTAKESRPTGTAQYSLRLPPQARILDWRYAVADGPTISPSRGTATEPVDKEALSATPSSGETSGNATAPSTGVPWKVVRRRTPDGDQTTLYFDGPASGFVIEVDAVLPHEAVDAKPIPPGSSPTGDSLKLGWMQLEHLSGSHASSDETEFEQVHDLQITRSVDTQFEWIESLGAKRITDEFEDAAALLTAGKVLVERFTSTGPLDRLIDEARFRVRKLDPVFDVDSRITLRWEEGRWTAQTDCEIKSKYCPDFIDVALPTRWCDSLQIEPLCVSSRQPTLDPALQVMRIELRSVATEGQAAGDNQPIAPAKKPVTAEIRPVRKFRLVSRLAVSETARVSVPDIRILDARRHRIDVVVPTRLTNEQVRWRSNFAGPVEKPRWTVETPMRLPDDSALSVYAVTSPGWSIDLETLPQTNRRAKCLHTDHRILVRPHQSRALMISRFDILPGDQSFVRLRHSGVAELLGVWAATRPADLRELPPEPDSVAGSDKQEMAGLRRWDVPLPLSRLSQTVEVLTSFHLTDFHSQSTPSESYSLLLPSLVGVSDPDEAATVSWCETLESGDLIHSNAADWIESPISPALRSQILASSLVRAIAASSDALADRRDEEVAVWMQPWLQRYRVLSQAVGRTIGQDETSEDQDGASDSAENPIGRQPPALTLEEFNVNEAVVLPWMEMDRFVLNQEARYFAGDSESFTDSPVPSAPIEMAEFADGNWSDFLSLSTPPGYVARWTFQWRQRTLPVARLALHQGWLPELTRQHIMRAGVFLAAAAFVLIPVVLPRSRKRPERNGRHDEPAAVVKSEAGEWSSGYALRHPAAWLFALGLIGLLLMPVPISLGLMFAAMVMSVIDPGYPAFRRWWRA